MNVDFSKEEVAKIRNELKSIEAAKNQNITNRKFAEQEVQRIEEKYARGGTEIFKIAKDKDGAELKDKYCGDNDSERMKKGVADARECAEYVLLELEELKYSSFFTVPNKKQCIPCKSISEGVADYPNQNVNIYSIDAEVAKSKVEYDAAKGAIEEADKFLNGVDQHKKRVEE